MPAFRFEALDATGKTVNGLVDADNPKAARAQLRTQHMVPLKVVPVQVAESEQSASTRLFSRRVFNSSELAVWTRQLSGLVVAGLPLERALTALADEAEDPRQRELVAHLRATIPRLRDGESLLHSTLGQQLDICASYLELMRLRVHSLKGVAGTIGAMQAGEVVKEILGIGRTLSGTLLLYDALEARMQRLALGAGGAALAAWASRDAMAQAANYLISLIQPLASLTMAEEPGLEPEPSAEAQIPLEELNLSVRAYNCLKRAQVNSVSDLMGFSYEDLLEIKNFGSKSADEVIEALERIGISLPQSRTPA